MSNHEVDALLHLLFSVLGRTGTPSRQVLAFAKKYARPCNTPLAIFNPSMTVPVSETNVFVSSLENRYSFKVQRNIVKIPEAATHHAVSDSFDCVPDLVCATLQQLVNHRVLWFGTLAAMLNDQGLTSSMSLCEAVTKSGDPLFTYSMYKWVNERKVAKLEEDVWRLIDENTALTAQMSSMAQLSAFLKRELDCVNHDRGVLLQANADLRNFIELQKLAAPLVQKIPVVEEAIAPAVEEAIAPVVEEAVVAPYNRIVDLSLPMFEDKVPLALTEKFNIFKAELYRHGSTNVRFCAFLFVTMAQVNAKRVVCAFLQRCFMRPKNLAAVKIQACVRRFVALQKWHRTQRAVYKFLHDPWATVIQQFYRALKLRRAAQTRLRAMANRWMQHRRVAAIVAVRKSAMAAVREEQERQRAEKEAEEQKKQDEKKRKKAVQKAAEQKKRELEEQKRIKAEKDAIEAKERRKKAVEAEAKKAKDRKAEIAILREESKHRMAFQQTLKKKEDEEKKSLAAEEKEVNARMADLMANGVDVLSVDVSRNIPHIIEEGEIIVRSEEVMKVGNWNFLSMLLTLKKGSPSMTKWCTAFWYLQYKVALDRHPEWPDLIFAIKNLQPTAFLLQHLETTLFGELDEPAICYKELTLIAELFLSWTLHDPQKQINFFKKAARYNFVPVLNWFKPDLPIYPFVWEKCVLTTTMCLFFAQQNGLGEKITRRFIREISLCKANEDDDVTREATVAIVTLLTPEPTMTVKIAEALIEVGFSESYQQFLLRSLLTQLFTTENGEVKKVIQRYSAALCAACGTHSEWGEIYSLL